MDIDWDKAPEGATHYCKMAAGFRGHGDSLCSYCIPRPTQKAQEVEWVDGLPPVGLPVELSYTPEDYRWWPKGQVIAYHKEWVIFEREGKVRPLIRTYDCVRFRPLRSREERERDELADLLGRTVQMRSTFGEMAEALMAEGWKKEQQP